MAVGTRLRFEILKRDGFRCQYCGATPLKRPLEIDHVVPASRGGTDDPANLVTACWDCNRGKSNKHLEESGLPDPMPAEVLREQAGQIRDLLAAQEEVELARDEVREAVGSLWCKHHLEDDNRYPTDLYRKALGLLERHTMAELSEAFAISASNCRGGMVYRWKYAQTVLRNRRERREARAS